MLTAAWIPGKLFIPIRIPILPEVSYPDFMHRSKRTLFGLISGLSLLVGCGLIPGRSNAGDVADAFYEYQLDVRSTFPTELFVDEQAAKQAESLVKRKEMAVGPYTAHNRIGTNRRVSMAGRGRKESVTYIFEVTGENGKTRETLMISRNSAAEPFLITAYVVEDVPRLQDPAPAGTSST